MEEDGKEEKPRHIISKTAEEISCIRTAMKGDGVLRKLSEAQLNALINEFEDKPCAHNAVGFHHQRSSYCQGTTQRGERNAVMKVKT